MADSSASFYITTPIYYVNARPHIGHTYTTVATDAIARRRRMLGDDVWFLTGTDEHGQKIERSAALAGKAPQQFTDEVSAEFRGLWDRMGLTYDDYIRTTEGRHKRGVAKLWNVLRERGFLYKGTYTGQYCVWDELYVEAGPGAPCPDCGRTTETVSEENYFFKLSAFETKLLEIIWQPDESVPGWDSEESKQGKLVIEPRTRRNEVLAFVRGGLRDLSVSRTSFQWGIPVPGDEKHVIYVWLDALANYLTALGYGSDDESRFEKFWPARYHIIGKEISRFHCVYWPAFLLAAGLPLPKAVVAHGWLLFEQSKMSKSRGNIVRAETILAVLGADALRYFLLREIVFGQDGSFSFDALVQRYNADLANGYGNLVSRTLAMIGKYFDGVLPAATFDERISAAATATIDEAGRRFDLLDFSRGLESVWNLVALLDGYITERAPWKLAALETGRAELETVLATAAEAIRIITALVYPILPDAAAKVWAQLGLSEIAAADLRHLSWGGLQPGTHLGALGPVFPRAEKDSAERMQAMEQENAKSTPATPTTPEAVAAPVDPTLTPVTPPAPLTPPTLPAISLAAAPGPAPLAPLPVAAFEPGLQALEDAALVGQITVPAAIEVRTTNAPDASPSRPDAMPQITIDDFLKVELRVAQILVAERVPKADKLLRLEVDLGYERRQILAGIAETYAPETLIGRKVVIVANLAPRKLRGFESNGMVVAASLGEHGQPSLAGFLDHVEIGARLK